MAYSTNVENKLRRTISQLQNSSRLIRSLPKKEYEKLAREQRLDLHVKEVEKLSELLERLLSEQETSKD